MNPETMQEIAVFNLVGVLFILLNALAIYSKIVRRIMRGPVWWVALVAFSLYWVITAGRAYLNPVPWGMAIVVFMGIAAVMSIVQMRTCVQPGQSK